MKKWILIWVCLLPLFAAAQPPAGYYDSAEGLSGSALKTALHNIISTGFVSTSYDGLWDVYPTTDKKPNGKVWDMYSDVPGGTPPYEFTFVTDQCGSYSSEGDCYNREHSVPQSWFGGSSPMYSDIFHVVPTDGKVNGQRSNYPFGEVSSASWTSQNGSKLGSCSFPGYTGTVFEPVDSFKGDFARIYFYMCVRYKDEMPSWTGESFSSGDLSTWTENMLLQWHVLDPVSTKEIDRNNDVYGIQHNRNPFVDNPDWVFSIWGPTAGVETGFQQSVSVFPNPADETINIRYATAERPDKVYLCDLQGRVIDEVTSETLIETINIPEGFYFLKFIFKNGIAEKEFVIMH
jgi:endonuclease I